jgi:RNA polymerase sigma factor (TIGR02999 family)
MVRCFDVTLLLFHGVFSERKRSIFLIRSLAQPRCSVEQKTIPLRILVKPPIASLRQLCHRRGGRATPNPAMQEITRLLNAVANGDSSAAEELLPLIYQELRRRAAQKMVHEACGHTLQPTALVHEAWLRLDPLGNAPWKNRAHFFGAASEAMRRILVEHARRKLSLKRGAGAEHVELDEVLLVLTAPPEELLEVHDALDEFEKEHPDHAKIVKLLYFLGLTQDEAAEVLGISETTLKTRWKYARKALHLKLTRRGFRSQSDAQPAPPDQASPPPA